MKPGHIVLVKFPFSNLETSKKRPALVLRSIPIGKSSLSVIAMITSKTDGISLAGDVLLEEWESAQLLHPSLVRLSKLATIDAELIERPLGSLSKKDKETVSKVFKKLFDFWTS